MELQKIEQLIERYFEGETTLAEEQQLKKYFSQNEIAEHLKVYQPMFEHFLESKKETMPKDIAEPKSKRSYKWFAIAATILVVLGVSIFLEQNTHTNSEQEKVYAAYLETKEALEMTSKIFNKGAEQLAYIEEFEISKNKVFK